MTKVNPTPVLCSIRREEPSLQYCLGTTNSHDPFRSCFPLLLSPCSTRSSTLSGRKEYASAFQVALHSSWGFLSAWGSVIALVLSPVLQFLAVLAGAIWPHARRGAITLWRFQASLSLSTLCAEAAVVVFVILAVLLRRFIVRRRYLPRAQRRVLLFRARVNRGYLRFTASVERNFRLSARAFPHVVYWTAAAAFGWIAPDFSAALRDKTWVFVTVTWPTLYALYLALLIRGQGRGGVPPSPGKGGRTVSGGENNAPAVAATSTSRSPVVRVPRRSPMSPGEAALARRVGVTPHDVDRVLMYWVVFTVARCCGALPGYVPFASSVVDRLATSPVRTAAFFFVLWVHLPGPGSGLEVGGPHVAVVAVYDTIPYDTMCSNIVTDRVYILPRIRFRADRFSRFRTQL